MKIHLPSFSLVAAIFFAGAAHAGSVSVSAKETGGREKDKKDKFTTSQEKKLTISVQNVSHAALENLKVKIYFFGRDMNAKAVTVLSQSEKTVSVPAVSTTTVESDSAKTSFTEKHMDKKTSVPASGSKFAGYGIQVFDGNNLAGEYFSPPEMKQKLGGGSAQ